MASRSLSLLALLAAAPACFVACSSSSSGGGAAPFDAGGDGDAAPADFADGGGDGAAAPKPRTKIEHLIVVVQENHTFDTYFGKYCTAATGSGPTCTTGPACCEAGPDKEPGGASPVILDDARNSTYDPDHTQACEAAEMNGGKMDRYVTGAAGCSNAQNFAYADAAAVKTYRELAAAGALADRYFQPTIGQSSSNDMYFARAAFTFLDNSVIPASIGRACSTVSKTAEFTDKTIADLLLLKGATFAWYGEGYKQMVDGKGNCPDPPADCALGASLYPCVYDPGDVPFQFYPTLRDKPEIMRDLAQLDADLAGGKLPAVSFVKGLGYHSEHPGYKDTIAAGTAFVKGITDKIAVSSAAASTLVLVTFDEGGGFFDHVPPPADSIADGKPYGTRVPLLAVGPFARKNAVSHVTMEHSSIVKFIEWNWLGATGQLGTRDAEVNNLGSLLDPAATGTPVPEK